MRTTSYNRDFLIGAALGAILPLGATAAECARLGSWNLATIYLMHQETPLMQVLVASPLAFGLIAMFFGTVRTWGRVSRSVILLGALMVALTILPVALLLYASKQYEHAGIHYREYVLYKEVGHRAAWLYGSTLTQPESAWLPAFRKLETTMSEIRELDTEDFLSLERRWGAFRDQLNQDGVLTWAVAENLRAGAEMTAAHIESRIDNLATSAVVDLTAGMLGLVLVLIIGLLTLNRLHGAEVQLHEQKLALEDRNGVLESQRTELSRFAGDLSSAYELLSQYSGKLETQKLELEAMNDRLRTMARLDPVTGLGNHRAFQEELERQLEMRHAVSLLMIDVDSFKDFNDSFGHPAGDQILRGIAQTLTLMTRECDFIGRYAGDEFVVILPGLDEAAAADIAERLRDTVASGDWHGRQITVSIGVAGGDSRGRLIEDADRALYWSKTNGRNLVSTASDITLQVVG